MEGGRYGGGMTSVEGERETRFAAPEGSFLRAELRFVREIPRLALDLRDLAETPTGDQLVAFEAVGSREKRADVE